jgi:hypothetical protein
MCPRQGQSGVSLFNDAIRIGDLRMIGVAGIGSHVQPGGAGSPLGVPVVNVFSVGALRCCTARLRCSSS